MFSRPIGAKPERRYTSLSETARRVFANLQYPAKERRGQFKNRWNRIRIRFDSTSLKGASFN
jgi:hypothetical protein